MLLLWLGLVTAGAEHLELDLETSFLQISVASVTEDAPWAELHLSVYLLGFLLVPVFAAAFLCPKWVVVAMIACADSLCAELPMAIFPLITDDALILGALFAMKPLGQAVATPLVLRFARHRELHLMKLGLLLQSSGLLLQAFIPGAGAWFGARAAQGVASALIMEATAATGTEAMQEAEAKGGLVDQMALVYSMMLGVICGAPLGGLAFSIDPFLPFLSLALAELVLLAAVNVKMDSPSPPNSRPIRTPLLSMLKFPMVSRPLTLVCLLFTYNSALQAMIFKVLEDDFGLSVESSGFIWLFQAWPAILTWLLLGQMAQAIGFRLIMLSGIVAAGAGAMVIDDHSLTLLIGELLVAGFAIGAENATVPRLMEDIGSRHFQVPDIYVLLNLSQQLACVVGPVMGGLFVRLSGLQAMGRAFGVVLLGYAMSYTLD